MALRREAPHQTVTHLATGHFRESRGYATWRSRGTEDWLLVLTLAGRGRFGYESGELLAGPGDLVLLRPGTPHDYGIAAGETGWELLWTHFHPRPAWHEWLGWPEAAPGLLHLFCADAAIRARITARFHEAHQFVTRSSLRLREILAMNALEEVLLWCDTQNPRGEQARLDPRIGAAMEYLRRHLAEKITVSVLAHACGLSVSRLAHRFREQVGMTPQQYLERERLARARQLLELTPRSVAVIAAEVGFENPFYFSLRFKRHTGLSPRDWRRRSGTD